MKFHATIFNNDKKTVCGIRNTNPYNFPAYNYKNQLLGMTCLKCKRILNKKLNTLKENQ